MKTNYISKFSEKAFYKKDSTLFIVINDALSLIIFISVITIILESVPGLSKYSETFNLIEKITVIIFSLEYILRIIGSKNKLSYIFSFFGLIDILSVLPTWFNIANFTPLKLFRALRILRFMRMMRLAKVVRFEHLKKRSSESKYDIIKMNLKIYLLTLFFTVTILGSLIHVVEISQPAFNSIPLGMLWVLEALLGGSISGVLPQTHAGVAIFMIARLINYILLGFIIHIIGTFISQILLGRKARGDIE